MKKRNAAKLRTHVVTKIKGIEKGTGKHKTDNNKTEIQKKRKAKTEELKQLLINQR